MRRVVALGAALAPGVAEGGEAPASADAGLAACLAKRLTPGSFSAWVYDAEAEPGGMPVPYGLRREDAAAAVSRLAPLASRQAASLSLAAEEAALAESRHPEHVVLAALKMYGYHPVDEADVAEWTAGGKRTGDAAGRAGGGSLGRGDDALAAAAASSGSGKGGESTSSSSNTGETSSTRRLASGSSLSIGERAIGWGYRSTVATAATGDAAVAVLRAAAEQQEGLPSLPSRPFFGAPPSSLLAASAPLDAAPAGLHLPAAALEAAAAAFDPDTDLELAAEDDSDGSRSVWRACVAPVTAGLRSAAATAAASAAAAASPRAAWGPLVSALSAPSLDDSYFYSYHDKKRRGSGRARSPTAPAANASSLCGLPLRQLGEDEGGAGSSAALPLQPEWRWHFPPPLRPASSTAAPTAAVSVSTDGDVAEAASSRVEDAVAEAAAAAGATGLRLQAGGSAALLFSGDGTSSYSSEDAVTALNGALASGCAFQGRLLLQGRLRLVVGATTMTTTLATAGPGDVLLLPVAATASGGSSSVCASPPPPFLLRRPDSDEGAGAVALVPAPSAAGSSRWHVFAVADDAGSTGVVSLTGVIGGDSSSPSASAAAAPLAATAEALASARAARAPVSYPLGGWESLHAPDLFSGPPLVAQGLTNTGGSCLTGASAVATLAAAVSTIRGARSGPAALADVVPLVTALRDPLGVANVAAAAANTTAAAASPASPSPPPPKCSPAKRTATAAHEAWLEGVEAAVARLPALAAAAGCGATSGGSSCRRGLLKLAAALRHGADAAAAAAAASAIAAAASADPAGAVALAVSLLTAPVATTVGGFDPLAPSTAVAGTTRGALREADVVSALTALRGGAVEEGAPTSLATGAGLWTTVGTGCEVLTLTRPGLDEVTAVAAAAAGGGSSPSSMDDPLVEEQEQEEEEEEEAVVETPTPPPPPPAPPKKKKKWVSSHTKGGKGGKAGVVEEEETPTPTPTPPPPPPPRRKRKLASTPTPTPPPSTDGSASAYAAHTPEQLAAAGVMVAACSCDASGEAAAATSEQAVPAFVPQARLALALLHAAIAAAPSLPPAATGSSSAAWAWAPGPVAWLALSYAYEALALYAPQEALPASTGVVVALPLTSPPPPSSSSLLQGLSEWDCLDRALAAAQHAAALAPGLVGPLAQAAALVGKGAKEGAVLVGGSAPFSPLARGFVVLAPAPVPGAVSPRLQTLAARFFSPLAVAAAVNGSGAVSTRTPCEDTDPHCLWRITSLLTRAAAVGHASLLGAAAVGLPLEAVAAPVLQWQHSEGDSSSSSHGATLVPRWVPTGAAPAPGGGGVPSFFGGAWDSVIAAQAARGSSSSSGGASHDAEEEDDGGSSGASGACGSACAGASAASVAAGALPLGPAVLAELKTVAGLQSQLATYAGFGLWWGAHNLARRHATTRAITEALVGSGGNSSRGGVALPWVGLGSALEGGVWGSKSGDEEGAFYDPSAPPPSMAVWDARYPAGPYATVTRLTPGQALEMTAAAGPDAPPWASPCLTPVSQLAPLDPTAPDAQAHFEALVGRYVGYLEEAGRAGPEDGVLDAPPQLQPAPVI